MVVSGPGNLLGARAASQTWQAPEPPGPVRLVEGKSDISVVPRPNKNAFAACLGCRNVQSAVKPMSLVGCQSGSFSLAGSQIWQASSPEGPCGHYFVCCFLMLPQSALCCQAQAIRWLLWQAASRWQDPTLAVPPRYPVTMAAHMQIRDLQAQEACSLPCTAATLSIDQ